jgi:uncharacterized protein (DUF1501 family)
MRNQKSPILGRREFLRTAAVSYAGLILLHAPGWLAYASSGTSNGKRLIVIFLRGAVDGLNVVVPYGDPEYYEARPTLAIPRSGEGAILKLDDHFGLHPALESLLPIWQEGTLGFVHACGSPDPTRSHFDAQDYMESGTPGRKNTPDGWMNRVLAAIPNHSPTEAVGIGPVVPRILSGRMEVANIAIGRGAAQPLPLDRPVIEAAFDRLYQGSDALSVAYRQGRAARQKLMSDLQADMAEANNGAPSPQGFPEQAERLASMIRRDASIRLAFAALGGWDTHVNQGATSGQLANHLRPLGEGLARLKNALGPVYGQTVIIVISEFGRTVHENGNAGTDHGHGNVMWIMGGPIRGGKVYGRWAGLTKANLYQERDLAITTDFRVPISMILREHLALTPTQIAHVFPDAPTSEHLTADLLRI